MTSEIANKNNGALPLRVLIIEDCADDAALVERELRRGGYNVASERVETAEAMRTALDRAPWDIILSDYAMPTFSAPAALKVLQASPLDLPFIIISGTIGEEVAVESLKAGAHDYLMKGKLTRLTSAVRRELASAEQRRQQKRDEEALARTAQEWRTTFNASNDAIWLLDEAHRIVRSNQQADRLFPSSVGSEGTRCWEVVHGTTGPIADCPVVRAKESLQRETMELQVGDLWYLVTADPVLDANGHYAGAVHVLRDVTNRKQAEEQLKSSESRTRAYLNNSPACTKILDPDFNLQYMSRAGIEGLHIDRIEDYYGHPYPFDFYPQSFKDMMTQNLKKAKETGEIITQEAAVVDVDGNELWFHSTITPVHDEVGQLDYILIVSINITERKQANEALRESESRFRDLFEDAPLGYQSLDENGDILELNKTWCKLLGYTKEEAIGRNFGEFIRSDFQEQFAENFPKFKSQGSIAGTEFEMIRKDGSEVSISIDGTIQHETDGSFKQTHCVLKDITEQKSLEKQFRQAQKMESVGQLAGGVAHDFNNKLQVILGHTELALGKIDASDQVHESLIEIQTAALHSADLTRQLLAFARKQIIAPEVLDLNATVDEMLKMLRRLIGEDINLHWEPSAKLWPIKMDPSQIDQILANLCVNARDALEGTGNVTIETRNLPLDQTGCAIYPDCTPGDYMQLSFSDDGCGMNEKTLKHLFEPFFTTKKLGEGTGLGLATLYGIVKQNHGFITVDSAPGKGTTFKIHLPRCTDKEVAARKAAETKPPERGQETILLVEDDAGLLDLGQQMLEGLGYTVLAAALPEEARRLSKEHPGKIDLLLTDVIMPEMNGQDLAAQLKKARPELKCIFMSGYTADVIARNNVLAEGVHFIQKPFSIPDLATKMRQVLEE